MEEQNLGPVGSSQTIVKSYQVVPCISFRFQIATKARDIGKIIPMVFTYQLGRCTLVLRIGKYVLHGKVGHSWTVQTELEYLHRSFYHKKVLSVQKKMQS
jgi:hypothetical protein